jgi:hypothetical protein
MRNARKNRRGTSFDTGYRSVDFIRQAVRCVKM